MLPLKNILYSLAFFLMHCLSLEVIQGAGCLLFGEHTTKGNDILYVTGRPWENRLNWIPDPAPAPSRDHGKKEEKEAEENHPPASQPFRIPRKIQPRWRKRAHRQEHLQGANGNSPGIDLRPIWMKRMPQKHPQPPKHPQHPQHPRPAANKNSSRVNPQDQADPGRLYKQAPPSRVKESTKRSRRDYF